MPRQPAVMPEAFMERDRGAQGRRRNSRAWKCTPHRGRYERVIPRSRSAFPTTDTELKLIAAAAIMGLSRVPKKG